MDVKTERIFDMPEERLRAKDDEVLRIAIVLLLCVTMALIGAVVVANSQGIKLAMADEGFQQAVYDPHQPDIPGGIVEEANEAVKEEVLDEGADETGLDLDDIGGEVAEELGYSGRPEEMVQAVSYSPEDLQYHGVLHDGLHTYTWYSQQVLPGGGLDISGRHVSGEGFVRDGDGLICVASSDYEKGTELDSPFGRVKVYDTGCASGTLDVYVDW